MSDRRLTVLGCDGGFPGPNGAGSGYLVQAGGTTVLVDAGPGTFANLQRLGDPGRIDGVILSHEHPDHWSDLESFAVWLLQPGGGKRVDVHAPTGLRRRSYFAESPVLGWHEIGPASVLVIGSLTLHFSTTDHGPPTLAVRLDALDGDAALAYSADSGPDWSLDDLGPGIGTFLCEATYLAGMEGTNRHLSGRQAGVLAAAGGVGRLIVTHRSPTVSADALVAEAEASFGRTVDQAVIGRVFEW
jgi:ribonuclease BN (tRNA processing enzyme)